MKKRLIRATVTGWVDEVIEGDDEYVNKRLVDIRKRQIASVPSHLTKDLSAWHRVRAGRSDTKRYLNADQLEPLGLKIKIETIETTTYGRTTDYF